MGRKPAAKKAKRDEALRWVELLPEKSRDAYVKAWTEFSRVRISETRKTAPPVEKLQEYFDGLRDNGEYKGSTLWTRYSLLNAVFQAKWGLRFQEYAPQVGRSLKVYGKDEEPKQANPLEFSHLAEYCNKVSDAGPGEDVDAYDLVRAAAAMTMFAGGLRCAEAQTIKRGDVSEGNDGALHITYKHKKRRASEAPCVPFVIPDSFTSPLRRYLDASDSACGSDPERPLFLTGVKGANKYKKTPLGINQIYGVARHIAEKLGLDDAHTYTGHSMRRGCAKLLADRGASITDLQRHFGWKATGIAQRYCDASVGSATDIAAKIFDTAAPPCARESSNPVAPAAPMPMAAPTQTVINVQAPAPAPAAEPHAATGPRDWAGLWRMLKDHGPEKEDTLKRTLSPRK